MRMTFAGCSTMRGDGPVSSGSSGSAAAVVASASSGSKPEECSVTLSSLHCQPLTRSSTLPMCSLDSTSRCASAASSRVSIRSITGCTVTGLDQRPHVRVRLGDDRGLVGERPGAQARGVDGARAS